MVEERFEFSAKAKKNLLIVIVAGIIISVLGIIAMNMGGGHGEHASAADGHGFHWTQRLFANIWINNVYFAGLAIIGVFFFALQYAAQAGWSAGVKRVAMSFGAWLPIAFVLMIVSFFAFGHDIFHWTHHDLYDIDSPDYDSIIAGKSGFFFWPLHAGGFPFFFVARMVIFFGLWYWLFSVLKKHMLAEDLEGGTSHWYAMRKYSAIFLVIFAVSSSVAAWDWIMSIDTHWFSTMFGWYMFASWWVAALALLTMVVVMLKDAGYLSIVNSNHLHDLGKFVFAFSIFWTYIWFSQFFLIYYSNIPEETIYFYERWKTGPYVGLFYFNLIINFFLPFLLLMTRDSKRHSRFLKVFAPLVIIGHWFDFYLMVTPGVLKNNGSLGLIELGLFLIYGGAFIYVVLNQIAKAPLYGKNDPMLEESVHHHI